MLVKDRDYLAKIDKLERMHSKTLQEEQIAKEEMESELKNSVRMRESEVLNVICYSLTFRLQFSFLSMAWTMWESVVRPSYVSVYSLYYDLNFLLS